MSAGLIALTLSALWLICALMIPFLRQRFRPAALWAMVALGVPLLGWLTLHWGPGAGVLGFALGLAALVRPMGRRAA